MRTSKEKNNVIILILKLTALTTMIVGLITGIVYAFEHDRKMQLKIEAGEIPKHHIDVVEMEKATCYVYSAPRRAGLSCIPK